jgi:hypothetical protein
LNNQHPARQSRKNLRELMINHQSTISIDDVIKKMNRMVEGQKIIFKRN